MRQSSREQGVPDEPTRSGPDNFEVRRADRVEVMEHLDPAGAFTGLDLGDYEGIAIRAALDMIGQLRDPPVTGNAAIRAALRDYLIGLGYWPAEPPRRPAHDPADGP